MAVKLRRHREGRMTLRQVLASTVAAIAIAAMNLAVPDSAAAQQPAVEIDKADIGGVVTGPSEPEAGVWVIAETNELPTKYAKMVVTDDQGRYVIPDLPTANYNVWVRGYGLIDSPKLRAKRGRGGALLSGHLLVFDDEDSGSKSVRGQEQHSGKAHAGRLAQADEEYRLHRLSPARTGVDAHDSGAVRLV